MPICRIQKRVPPDSRARPSEGTVWFRTPLPHAPACGRRGGYVCAAAALVVLVAGTVWRALHRVEPDYRVAYVGSLPLPDDAVASLETALAALGEDLNDDGAVVGSCPVMIPPKMS